MGQQRQESLAKSVYSLASDFGCLLVFTCSASCGISFHEHLKDKMKDTESRGVECGRSYEKFDKTSGGSVSSGSVSSSSDSKAGTDRTCCSHNSRTVKGDRKMFSDYIYEDIALEQRDIVGQEFNKLMTRNTSKG